MAPLLHSWVAPLLLALWVLGAVAAPTTTTTTTQMNMTAVLAELQHLRSTVARMETELISHSQQFVTMDGRMSSEKAAHEDAYDTCWTLYSTSLVMLMQLGFALVEAGTVRHKSFRHVFLKNLLDFSVGVSLWFIFGYWIAFPDKWNGMILDFEKYEQFYISAEARYFVFQTVFSSTAITIVSGAMAERTRMEAYLAFCGLCSGMLYSVVVRWSWGGGWLAEMDVPFHDFAGSGVVHATGGSAAFIGAFLVGPRIGRFDTSSSLRLADHYKPHSMDEIIMGTFILWYGWFGFNPGSTTSVVGSNAATASFAYVNTMICPCWSAMTVMVIGLARHKFSKAEHHDKPPPFNLGKICNGILGGLVAITAGCDSIPVKWTVVVGICAGCGVEGWSDVMAWLRIDDPVDAVAVHGFCGVTGLIVTGLFDKTDGLCISGDPALLVTQLKGAGAIVGYIGGTAFVYFYCVYAFGLLRTPMTVEIVGTDYHEYKDGDDFDSTELEMQEFQLEKSMLFARLEGTHWGISDEVALRYARMHRRTTVTWLVIGMVYNYFYYTHFEWRGWTFFSVVNIAVGGQCAAACHAEFKCKPREGSLKYYCALVIIIGMGLAICNFIIAPHDNLIVAWLRTMTLSFSWSWWFHLRVQPVDWEGVCIAEQSLAAEGKESSSRFGIFSYLRAMSETSRSKGACSYIASLFFSGRLQHIAESITAYASVTSDMWVGMDEIKKVMEDNGGSLFLAVVLIVFSILQFSAVLGRLIVPHKHRSINFFRCILFITAISEMPIALFVLFGSESELKWVSVTLSFGSVCLQVMNLMVATYLQKTRGQKQENPDETEIPTTFLKQAVEKPERAKSKTSVTSRDSDLKAPAKTTAETEEVTPGHMLVSVAHVSNEGKLPAGFSDDVAAYFKQAMRSASNGPGSAPSLADTSVAAHPGSSMPPSETGGDRQRLVR